MNRLPSNRFSYKVNDIFQLEADNHHLLCTIFENTYSFRSTRENEEKELPCTMNMMTTRIKLVTNKGVAGTQKFAQEWSRKHFNQNFFSITSVNRSETLKYPEPWCGEFKWQDNPKAQRNVLFGLQFHIASIQTIDLKNHSLHHPLFHLIIETFMDDHENQDKMQLVDCYSCDILIFYFESSKIYELFRAFNNGFVKKNYAFSRCYTFDTTFHHPSVGDNFEIIDENLFMNQDWVDIIQMITNIDDYCLNSPIEWSHSTDRPSQGEKGRERDPFTSKGPNFLQTHFLLKMNDIQVSRVINNGQDWAILSAEPFEISIKCQRIYCNEILNFNFSMTINDPKYDHLSINQKLEEYLINALDIQENKFLRFLPDRSCVGERILDYQQYRARPQNFAIKYIPELSKEFKVTFQILLSDNDIISLLNDGLITEDKPEEKTKLTRKSSKKKRNEPKIEEKEDKEVDSELDKTPDQPLKIRLMVEISSANYGTVYERHSKDVMVLSRIDYRRNTLYEEARTPKLKLDDQKDVIFHREEQVKHFLSQDGFIIKLENKATIDNFFRPDENFTLSLNNKNFHCRREFPNNPDKHIVIHYPDFNKRIIPSKQIDQVSRINFQHCTERLGSVQPSENYISLFDRTNNEHPRKFPARTKTKNNMIIYDNCPPDPSSAINGGSRNENLIETTKTTVLCNNQFHTNEIIINGHVVANGIPIIPSETLPCNSNDIVQRTVATDLTDSSVEINVPITKGLKSPANAFPYYRKALMEESKTKDQQISNGINFRYSSSDESSEMNSESDSGKETPPNAEDPV